MYLCFFVCLSISMCWLSPLGLCRCGIMALVPAPATSGSLVEHYLLHNCSHSVVQLFYIWPSGWPCQCRFSASKDAAGKTLLRLNPMNLLWNTEEERSCWWGNATAHTSLSVPWTHVSVDPAHASFPMWPWTLYSYCTEVSVRPYSDSLTFLDLKKCVKDKVHISVQFSVEYCSSSYIMFFC